MSVERDDWLPALPSGWAAVPAKSLFSLRSEKSRPDDVHLTPSQKYGVIPQSEYMEITGSRVVLNLVGADNMKHVEPGDFVIHLRSFQGGVEFSQHRGKVSAAYTVLTPTPLAEPRFFRWLLKSERYIQALQVSVDQLRDGQSIRYGDFAKIDLPLAPPDVQRRIADYLDRETATIDALIEKQRMLIGTLGERRRTMISEATTLGLKGRDDLIETSVPWVDRIPRRWQMMAARRIFALRREKSRPDAVHLTPSQKFGVLPQQEYMRLSGSRVVLNLTGADSMQAVEPSDFVIHLRSFEGGIEYSELAGKVSNAYTVLTPAKGVHAHFWRWMLKSQRYVEALRVTVDQLRDGQSIRYQDFAKVPLPVPPLDEQCEIADHLDRETAKIDALIAKAERFIELAQERRAALITAAVTGQIEIPTED